MAIQNIYAPLLSTLPEQKSIEDYQKQALAMRLLNGQVANNDIEQQINQQRLQQSQQDFAQQQAINEAGKNAVVYDELGNPTIDRNKLISGVTEVNPLKGVEVAKNYKDQDIALISSQLVQAKQVNDLLKDINGTIGSYIQGVKTAQDVNTFKEKARARVSLLPQGEIRTQLENEINNFKFEDKDSFYNEHLSTTEYLNNVQKQIDNKNEQIKTNLLQNKDNRENFEAQQKQSGYLTPQESKKQALEFNKTFKKEYLEPYNDFEDKSNKLLATLNQKGGLLDLASVYQYQKILDDGGVVQDRDRAMIAGAGGPIDKFNSAVQNLQSNGFLTAQGKTDMRTALNEFKKVAQNRLKSGIDDAKYQSDNFGIPLDQVIGKNTYDNFVSKEEKDKRKVNTKAPSSPFSFNANVPPPAYTGQPIIADSQGNVAPLNKNFTPPNVNNPNQTQPTIAQPKFTSLPLKDRQRIIEIARKKGISGQDLYNQYLSSKGQ